MDFATIQAIQECAATARIPGHGDQVFKDECMFSFDTPLSSGGLYINLSSWQAFGREYVLLDHNRTGNRLYLHEAWHKASHETLTCLLHRMPFLESRKEMHRVPETLYIVALHVHKPSTISGSQSKFLVPF